MSGNSLIEVQRKTLFERIRSIRPESRWKVLVLDIYCRRIIQEVIDLQDLLDENIVAIESLEDVRQPYAEFEAIYICKSSETTAKCIKNDFTNQRLYQKIHLFSIGVQDDNFTAYLKTSSAGHYIAQMDALYLDYYPREAKRFETSDFFSFQSLFNQECRSLGRTEIETIAQKIFCVCASLRQKPVIRYYRPTESNCQSQDLSRLIAEKVGNHLDRLLEKNPMFFEDSGRPTSLLLITDRTMDPVSPILHEFTYQAMIYDLVDIEDDRYEHSVETQDGTESKVSHITDDDKIWTEVRHLHMRDAIDKLMNDFNEFCQKNAKFTGKDQASTLSDMRAMLAGLSGFQETRDCFSLHLGMAQKCMSIFEKKQMPVIGAIEQDLAIGADSDGKIPKTVFENMVPLLDDPAMDRHDKIRLIFLYICYRGGLLETDFQRLTKHSKMTARDVEALKNLDILGVNARKPFSPHSKRANQGQPKRTYEDAYEISRYQPMLRGIIEDCISGALNPEVWHYMRKVAPEEVKVTSQQSLRSARPTWAKNKSSHFLDNRQRIFVFVAGGASYSESRACYELSKITNKDVILGSTYTMSPEDYISSLQMLREPRSMLQLPQDRPGPKIPALDPRPPPPPDPAQTPRNEAQKRSKQSSVNTKAPVQKDVPKAASPISKEQSKEEKKKKTKKFGIF